MIRNPEAEGLILEAIGAQPGITRPELIKVTGLTKEMVRLEVKRLSKWSKIHTDKNKGGRFCHPWYLKGELTIIQQVEKAVMDADKPVTGSEIAARLNLESQKVYNPLNKLLEDNKIYLGPSVGERDKAVMTYLHPDNRPVMTPMEITASSLGMSIEIYERMIDLELGPAVRDPEFRAFLNVYYAGNNATANFMS